MADELSDYLQGSYPEEKRDIERMKETASRILDVFDSFFLQKEGVWPYEVVDGGDVPSSVHFSFSTNAMIVFALAVATGRISRSELLPAVRQAPMATQNKDRLDRLGGHMKRALARFPSEVELSRKDPKEKDRWTDAQKERDRREDVPLVTTSPSFGPNDPLTLTWLLEVLGTDALAEPGDQELLLPDLTVAAQEIVTSAFEQPSHSPLRLESHELVSHTFPLLRVLHLFNTDVLRASDWQPVGSDQIHEFLLNRAHFHLSSSSIQNGVFDAGELVFSLEGVLLCDPSPDYSLFDRAFQVLADRQRETPYWRPLRPFRVTRQGMILLPQSVEIANSLLRICSRLDEGRDRSYFSDYVDLFKGYTSWLESRMFVGKTKDAGANDIFGWQSEHTFAPDRIHLWQTSQVLLYLVHYAAMLQGHIGRRSFRAARFFVASRDPDTPSWEDWEAREPMASLGNEGPYAVYRHIGQSIVRPRTQPDRSGRKPSSSILLYGPPGTGKSTIAKVMANELGYRLITITPSDFITAGEEGAEARAKNIFATLMEQIDLVVLFDEVDQLLLDRESDLYQAQGDIFKLITPGMLTKLNDLTERKEVVFVVATNYFERIDAAMKRPGRIDERLLVLPPDGQQREEFISRGKDGENPLFPSWNSLDGDEKNNVVSCTALCSYKELLDLAKRLPDNTDKERLTGKQICVLWSKFPPTISVASYKNRVLKRRDGKAEPEDGPLEEFVMVFYIKTEGEASVKTDPWMRKALMRARELGAVSEQKVWDAIETKGAMKA